MADANSKTPSAASLVKQGDPDAALLALQAEIRANAADKSKRVFLFQLLSVLGDWDRAIRQLKVSAEMDPAAVPMAQTYREGIICEVYREKVFSGEKDPLVFGEPQEWVALLIEALKVQAAGRAQDAAGLRAKAFEAAPVMGGTINDTPFEWVADADMRLGPVLEVIVNGRYFWMPFNQIGSIAAEAPVDLRDCVWTPVNMTLRNGGDIVALIPTRYAGTAEHGNAAERLARETNWHDIGAETFIGRGQRLLTTDAGDTALMDVRSLIMAQPDVAT
ncbi:type VI secretion system accessory protein TagJ [Pseudorhodobacter sp.]|uniref:type VI secretion system accessory protein TagJ n=1 Tax=Pseudorhodobacter sp. TaxID=1934400 RepID=UPI0026477D7C|nr:type VI secretion system accessory protein TagJ [Pseudorhodobacter sp.]MDN5787191.1 virulence protein SciE type [Pseudorhodobacter sp.]